MNIPNELQSLLKKASTEVKSSSIGELTLPMRRTIWSKIAKLSHDDLLTHRILTALDIECVRQTMPIWSKVFPDDDGPDRMLELAQNILDGKVDLAEAKRLSESFFIDVVENRSYQPKEYPAMFVGHAASNTVYTAFVELESDQEYFTKQDEDLDPESYEPSYLTASAYSGGLLGKGDTEKRRTFWLWYLQTAMERAYEKGEG
jgi:hypothetical protein